MGLAQARTGYTTALNPQPQTPNPKPQTRDNHKKWTVAQKRVEEQVLAPMQFLCVPFLCKQNILLCKRKKKIASATGKGKMEQVSAMFYYLVLCKALQARKKYLTLAKNKLEQVLAAMAAKHRQMEAAAKKSALADYWHSIKHSLHSEKTRLGGFGAAEARDRANRQMFDDATAQSKSQLRQKRSQLLRNKLSEMSQEKEMESESAYKDIQSHRLDYSSCDSDCQAARSITSGLSSGSNSYFGSSYQDNYMSTNNGYDQSDSSSPDYDFSAGR